MPYEEFNIEPSRCTCIEIDFDDVRHKLSSQRLRQMPITSIGASDLETLGHGVIMQWKFGQIRGPRHEATDYHLAGPE